MTVSSGRRPTRSRPGPGEALDHPAYADPLAVRFTAADGGTAPLTWGQRAIWKTLQWRDGDEQFFNGAAVVELAAGVTLDGVLDAVRALVVEHQSLRSHYPVLGGTPVQQVATAGTFWVGLVEVPDGADVSRTAEDLCGALRDRAFAPREWPWRVVVLSAGGTPRALVFVASHQIIDGWAFHALVGLLGDWSAGRRGDGPRALQPLEQVEFERSAQAGRRNEGSLRYWAQTLDRIPPTLFDLPPREPEPLRFVKMAMTSRACAVAAQTVAQRTGVSSAVVLIAATATVLAATTGHRLIPLSPIVANRFDRPRRGLVAPLTQDGLLAVDVARAATFDELVRATHRQALLSYHCAYYDPLALEEVVRRAETARGVALDVSAYVNDNRLGREWTATSGSRAELAELAASTTVEVTGAWERVDAKFFTAFGDDDSACRVEVTWDTAYLSRDTLRAALAGFEAVLVSAATGDLPTGDALALIAVPPARRGEADGRPGGTGPGDGD